MDIATRVIRTSVQQQVERSGRTDPKDRNVFQVHTWRRTSYIAPARASPLVRDELCRRGSHGVRNPRQVPGQCSERNGIDDVTYEGGRLTVTLGLTL